MAKRMRVDASLSVDVLRIVFSFLPETDQAVCRFVWCDWRDAVRGQPRMYAEDMARSISLLSFQILIGQSRVHLRYLMRHQNIETLEWALEKGHCVLTKAHGTVPLDLQLRPDPSVYPGDPV